MLAFTLFVSSCKNDTPESGVTSRQPMDAIPGIEQDPLRGSVITGKVVETLPAGGYTYLNIDQGTEKIWVALPAANVEVGQEVSVTYSMAMQQFESKTLNRTFDELIFASGFADGSTPPASPMGSSPSWGSSPHAASGTTGGSFSDALSAEGGAPGSDEMALIETGSNRAVVPSSDIKVDKAVGDNSYTVGEIFEKSSGLAGKQVLIAGKVVKVSPSIMGRNWIHLQDGTGDSSQNTHDLVVTSNDLPNMGDVITVQGTIASNKDFGAGYSYKVIVEEATIKR